MALSDIFLSCDELFSGRSGTPFNAGGDRDYVRRFRVVVQNNTIGKNIGPYGACICPGIPAAYAPYMSANGEEYDFLALMIKATAKQEHDDDWQNWIVECNYSTRMPDSGPPEGGGPNSERAGNSSSAMNNPEQEPPEVEWDFESTQKAIAKDLDGRAFTNSAMQPFSPPPMFEQAYPVLIYTRNELAFNIKTATRYAYAVNSDVFLGQKPGTAQCMPPKAKRVFRGGLSYWRVTYRIRFGASAPVQPANAVQGKAPKGFFDEAIDVLVNRIQDQLESWQPQFLDAGTMQLNPALNPEVHGKPTPIIKYGHPVTQPVLLDGAGREQRPDKNGVINPVFLKFRVYPARPFNKLIGKNFIP